MQAIVLPAPRSNPLAPRWMLPSFDVPYCEAPWKISQKFTTLAGTDNLNNAINVDKDADLIVREWVFGNNPAGEGGVGIQPPSFVRFRHGDGRWLMRDFINPQDIEGPVFTELILRAGKQLIVDIRQNAGANNICQITLKGAKRYYRRPLEAPEGFETPVYLPLWKRYSTPDPGYADEDFDFCVELSATASQFVPARPIRMDDDAPFFIRGILGDENITGTGDIRFAITDPYGGRLTQGVASVINSDLVQWANSIPTGNTSLVRPIFPEIPCPAGSALMISFQEFLGAAWDGRISLRGVKRFRV